VYHLYVCLLLLFLQYLNLWVYFQFDPAAAWITDGKNFGNPVLYNAKFKARFGYNADAPAAFGTAAPLLLHLAITKSGKLDQTSVRNALLNLNEETFMGRVRESDFTSSIRLLQEI